MTSPKPRWQPISMLPTMIQLIDECLEDTLENIGYLKSLLTFPGATYDRQTLKSFTVIFTERLEFLPVYKEQLRRWQRLKLTHPYRREVTRLREELAPLEAALTQGLALAEELKERIS